MDVLAAIRSRQSIGKLKSDPIPRETITQLLTAAVQAPSHYKVRPWRFVVLTGKAREKLGDVMAEIFHRKFPDVSPEGVDRERAKPLRSPLLIAVGVDEPSDSRVLEIENVCAAAAACENLLLAAHALGLGAHWRTGEPARDAEVKRFLGFRGSQQLIAFLYIGYPEGAVPQGDRPGWEDRTVWME